MEHYTALIKIVELLLRAAAARADLYCTHTARELQALQAATPTAAGSSWPGSAAPGRSWSPEPRVRFLTILTLMYINIHNIQSVQSASFREA